MNICKLLKLAETANVARGGQPLMVSKGQSLLANSSPDILRPIVTPKGTYQVVWCEQIHAHCLLFRRAADSHVSLLATHHNGYSCHALADRIVKGDRQQIKAQLQFIRDCGGTTTAQQHLTE